MKAICAPRLMMHRSQYDGKEVTLHVLCDACPRAYGAVLYLTSESPTGDVRAALMIAKSLRYFVTSRIGANRDACWSTLGALSQADASLGRSSKLSLEALNGGVALDQELRQQMEAVRCQPCFGDVVGNRFK